MKDLYKKVNYTSNIKALISTNIREYDLSKANINALYKNDIISTKEYKRYLTMNNIQRKVNVGLIIRNNPNVGNIIRKTIKESKKLLFEENNIKPENVLSIKNDAVFLIEIKPKITRFDNMVFIHKNTYSSFYKIFNMELYYYLDSINGIEKLHVKGISDNNLKLHEIYFIDFLKELFYTAETETVDDVLNY